MVRLEHGPDVTGHSGPELAIHVGDLCVLKCDRGLEFGQVTRLEDVESPGADVSKTPLVLRRATLQDQSRARENAVLGKMAHGLCSRKITELRLDMHLISVRYAFDRSLLAVTFMAEERVDFRELLKQLSGELKAQVEMRQVGVRDTARMVGGLGACGQSLCCARWLKEFEAVSVKMAKTQRLSLNPNTISGMCGRLKCCLRFEQDGYTACSQGFPHDGARVRCPQGAGWVFDKDILGRRVKVRLDDNRILEFPVDEVKTDDADAAPAGRPHS